MRGRVWADCRRRCRPGSAARAAARGHRTARTLRFRRVGRYDVAFRLQENTWNGTTSPQLVVRRIFDTPDHYVDLRERFAAEWRFGRLSPEAEAVFAELGLEEGSGWRSLLESPTFRALLDEQPPPLAQAA